MPGDNTGEGCLHTNSNQQKAKLDLHKLCDTAIRDLDKLYDTAIDDLYRRLVIAIGDDCPFLGFFLRLQPIFQSYLDQPEDPAQLEKMTIFCASLLVAATYKEIATCVGKDNGLNLLLPEEIPAFLKSHKTNLCVFYLRADEIDKTYKLRADEIDKTYKAAINKIARSSEPQKHEATLSDAGTKLSALATNQFFYPFTIVSFLKIILIPTILFSYWGIKEIMRIREYRKSQESAQQVWKAKISAGAETTSYSQTTPRKRASSAAAILYELTVVHPGAVSQESLPGSIAASTTHGSFHSTISASSPRVSPLSLSPFSPVIKDKSILTSEPRNTRSYSLR